MSQLFMNYEYMQPNTSSEDRLMYRGISVGSIMVKEIMKILLTRISRFYESQF